MIEHRATQLKAQPILRKLPGSIVFEDIILRRGKVDEARTTVSIALFDFNQGEVSRFTAHEAWPSRVEIGKLQAGSDSVLLETVHVTHDRLEVG